jgi:hypothetical protein
VMWMERTQYRYQWRTLVIAVFGVESPDSKLSVLPMTVVYVKQKRLDELYKFKMNCF